MVAILGIVVALILAAMFLLFRSAGRFGQQPSASERARHNGGNVRSTKPRADGLN